MDNDTDNTDKTSIEGLRERLREHWKDTSMTLSGPDVPSDISGEDFVAASRDFVRYGIHNEGSEYERFISLRYVADDDVEAIRNTPTKDLDYEDCLMDKPMIFDMDEQDWMEAKGTINMIHDSAFVFYDDSDEFYDKLQEAVENHNAENDTAGPAADGDGFTNG